MSYDLTEIVNNPYNGFDDVHSVEDDKLWVCWGHKKYVKPSPLEIWITEDLALRPPMPTPRTLDEYHFTPRFSVLPKRFENRIPSSVQKVLKEFNLLHKFADRISPNEDLSESNQQCLPSSDQNAEEKASVENTSSLGPSTSELPVYHGDPVVYRKQNNTDAEKMRNERKAKKAAKQQRRMQKNSDQPKNYVLQEEAENNLNMNNEVVPFAVSKYTLLNISQPAGDQFGGYVSPRNNIVASHRPPPVHEFIIEQLREMEMEKSPVNSAAEFPLISEPPSLIKEEPELSFPEQSTVDDEFDTKETLSGNWLILENIPDDTDNEELSEILLPYGVTDIQHHKTSGRNQSILLRLDPETQVSWAISCMHDQLLFGVNSLPVKCYTADLTTI